MTIDVRRESVPKATDRDEWLASRRPYFNASAAACLWDRHPFQSAADYAVEKLTGVGQSETRPMRRGRYLERSVADWYAAEYGVFLYEPECMYAAGPMLATVDRLVLHGHDAVIEIKTSSSYITEPEPYWLDQTQAEMLCTGIDRAVIVWLDASMDIQTHDLDADEQLQTEMLARAERFMAAIELGMVPDWITPDLSARHVATLYPQPEGEVELDAELVELVDQYRELRSTKKYVEGEMESIKNTIVRALGEHAVGIYEGEPMVTFKATSDRVDIDLHALRADYPDLVEKYEVLKPGGRRFLPVG